VEESRVVPEAQAAAQGRDGVVDLDLSAAVSCSLQETVEARLRGVRNYTRLLREVQERR
jgi:alkanesulfonate monooxygenase SsuD/methylene tetrahydromethanopterin reductase-like flavin-dependent oxidoreductase (luciferase family)